MTNIWVNATKKSILSELIAGAASLGCKNCDAIVIKDADLAEYAASLGSDVYLLGDGGSMAESYVDTIFELINKEKPEGLLFEASVTCRAIAGRLAAKIGTTALADVKHISEDFSTRHLIYGGGAIRTMKSREKPFIAIFGAGSFNPAATMDNGRIIEVPFVKPNWEIKVTSESNKPVATANLKSAARIVAVGLGLKDAADLAMINELAGLLEAEVGCTRPIAEGLDWMGREAYIGISGQFVKPDLYIAAGISGQVHHVVGMTDSKTVISINKDPDCAMMRSADYCAVGDLYEIIPALINKLKEE